MDPNQKVRRPVLDSDSDAPLMPARIEGSELIAEVARRQRDPVQIRPRARRGMDVDDSVSEVSMGTALEQDLAVSPRHFEDPREDAKEEFQDQFQQDLLRGTCHRVQRRVQDGDRDASMEAVERTDGWRRPSRRVALIPGSEGGTPRSIQDRVDVPSTVSASALEDPTIVPASSDAMRRLVLIHSQPTEPTWEGEWR